MGGGIGRQTRVGSDGRLAGLAQVGQGAMAGIEVILRTSPCIGEPPALPVGQKLLILPAEVTTFVGFFCAQPFVTCQRSRQIDRTAMAVFADANRRTLDLLCRNAAVNAHDSLKVLAGAQNLQGLTAERQGRIEMHIL